MRRLLVASLLLTCIHGSKAQAPVVTPETNEGRPPATATEVRPRSPEGRITGHIFCDDTRRPARGAVVMVLPIPVASTEKTRTIMSQKVTRVRSDGTYVADHLDPGEYTVLAALPGYLSPLAEVLGQSIGESDTTKERDLLARNGTIVVASAGTSTFDVTLQRGAALSGQVLYSDGTPAPSVSLQLEDTADKTSAGSQTEENQMARAFAQRIFAQQNLVTDDQGRFRIAGVKPGSYHLAVIQPVVPPDDPGVREGMGAVVSLMGVPDARSLRVYAGDTIHAATAKSFQLRPGDEVNGLQITLPLDAFHELRGNVTAKDGRTINQGQLTLTDTADDQLTFHANVLSDGTFTIPQVPAGNYTLAIAGAHTVESKPGSDPNMPPQYQPKIPVAAFADATQPIVIQDHDLEGVNLALGEIPLPKTSPNPAYSDDEP